MTPNSDFQFMYKESGNSMTTAKLQSARLLPHWRPSTYEGIFFYVGAVISLHVEAIFSMWWVSFSVCFGGYFWSCPPWQFFCGSPYCCFFTSQIFIFFQIVEVSIFWGNLFFSFLGRGGGGIKRGWSTFEHIYIVSQGACRARGVGYRVMIVVWETEMLTMGGEWAEVIYFSWCWGGGRWGKFFWWIE